MTYMNSFEKISILAETKQNPHHHQMPTEKEDEFPASKIDGRQKDIPSRCDKNKFKEYALHLSSS